MVPWYVFVLLAAVVYALAIITTKKNLAGEHSIEFLSANSLLIFLISLPLLFFANLSIPLSKLAMIYLASSLFNIALFYNTKAVHHMEISMVAPLMTFGPAIASILAVFLLKEFLSIQQAIGIIFLLAGAYTLQSKNKGSRLLDPIKTMLTSRYVFYLFFSLIMFAATFIMMRHLTNQSNPSSIDYLTFVFFLNAFSAVNFFIVISLFFRGVETYKAGFKSLKLIILAAFLITLYRILEVFIFSLPAIKIALVMSLKEIYILFAVFIGGKMFHEHNLPRKIVGTAIMLIGVYIILT